MSLKKTLPLLTAALLIALTTGCDRMRKAQIPKGVPEGATFDRQRGIWSHHGSDNKFQLFYSDGKLAEEGMVIENKRQGVWKKFATDGQSLSATGRYRDDRRIGTWKYFDGSGNLYLTIDYKFEPIRQFGFFYIRDYGNENGPYRRYYPDGSLEEQGHYVGGFKEGPVVRYYQNGKVSHKGNYLADSKEGTWRYYYPEGDLERTEELKAGLLNGYLTNYYPGGELYQKVKYKSGALVE